MMTMMLRVVLIVVSVITMTFMMRKIRQAKVQIEAAMFWVIMALILVVFAVVPGAADLCARLLGIYSTPNFLFLFMIWRERFVICYVAGKILKCRYSKMH